VIPGSSEEHEQDADTKDFLWLADDIIGAAMTLRMEDRTESRDSFSKDSGTARFSFRSPAFDQAVDAIALELQLVGSCCLLLQDKASHAKRVLQNHILGGMLETTGDPSMKPLKAALRVGTEKHSRRAFS